jgi:hypothetical protein
MRPRVHRVVPLSRPEIVERLEAAFGSEGAACCGTTSSRHADISICESKRHFWSPKLDLELHDVPGGTELRGKIGPHPDVWTMFLAIYAVSSFMAIGGSMLGFSQWWIATEPWGFWLVPAGGALALCNYLAAFVGQGLGHNQMADLSRFLGTTLDLPQPVEAEVLADARPV